jgi:hypothetical protein
MTDVECSPFQGIIIGISVKAVGGQALLFICVQQLRRLHLHKKVEEGKEMAPNHFYK